MNDNQQLIAAGFGFLTAVATLYYQAFSAGRQRQWDKEDILTALKAQGEISANSHKESNVARAQIISGLQEAKSSADNAYREANAVNEKIAALHTTSAELAETAKADRVTLQQNHTETRQQLQHIDTTSQDTNVHVKTIAAVIPSDPAAITRIDHTVQDVDTGVKEIKRDLGIQPKIGEPST